MVQSRTLMLIVAAVILLIQGRPFAEFTARRPFGNWLVFHCAGATFLAVALSCQSPFIGGIGDRRLSLFIYGGAAPQRVTFMLCDAQAG
jgi:hypothetical protein